ncbi:MAG: transcriptional regulator protein [Rhizobium sp.]|nr:transcriptional regulator protein [Rhizobium sp.]
MSKAGILAKPSNSLTDQLSSIDPKLPVGAQVYSSIRDSILNLRLEPKQALSEKELSLRLGVSRTPVREALIKLSEDGLVDVFPQRGTFVAPVRMKEVLEAQFIREALEVAVVGRVAEHANEVLVQRLRENLKRQKLALDQSLPDNFLIEDEAFHYALCEFADLPRGWKVIQNVKGQMDRVRVLSLPDPGHVAGLYLQHVQIVDAIEARDAEVARLHMRRHLQQVFHTITSLLRDKPQLFD